MEIRTRHSPRFSESRDGYFYKNYYFYNKIVANEIYFDKIKSTTPQIDYEWMLMNIGKQRQHPLLVVPPDATFKFLLGKWGVEEQSRNIFYWFENKSLIAIFMLMYGGNPSWEIRNSCNYV
jgi:hypothetical protein